jgi:hypothetical protein
MTTRRVTISARPPADPATEAWIRGASTDAPPPKADVNTARLTVDVTPELRARIKVTAFRQGMTVADMLRALLEREYPDGSPS